jgi:hypothetical protein
MNERIKQLMDKSMDYYSNGYVDYPELNPEKFAQLIVRDCIDAISNVEEMYFNSIRVTAAGEAKNRYAEAESACQMAKRKIETRYGVE